MSSIYETNNHLIKNTKKLFSHCSAPILFPSGRSHRQTKEEWENGGKMEYAEQAKMCCPKTLYVNSICEGDAFGGAAFFVDGQIQRELAIYNEGILFVEI